MSIIVDEELNYLDCYLLASAIREGAKIWRKTAEHSSESKEMMLSRADKLDMWANKLTDEANSYNMYKQKPKKKK